MRSEADIRKVFELWERGVPKKAIARQTGISHTQVRRWIALGVHAVLRSPMRTGAQRHAPTLNSSACPLVQHVDERAHAYLLGVYHWDGCRVTNRVVRPTKTGPKLYECPRYMFKKESGFVHVIFIEACRRIGVE